MRRLPSWPRRACATPTTISHCRRPPDPARARTGDLRTHGPTQPRCLHRDGPRGAGLGQLGQHNGLPATIIVSTTLHRTAIRRRAGRHRRRHPAADGRRHPDGQPRAPLPGDLRRTHRRTALPRTHQTPAPHPDSASCCTPATAAAPAPAAPYPGYGCQAHHARRLGVTDGHTDIDDHWPAAPTTASSKRPAGPPENATDGRTEWIPPPHLDTGQARVNNYHHPERYLLPDDEGQRRRVR